MKPKLTLLIVLSLISAMHATERPVDATAIVGHWVLQEVKTNKGEIKASIARTKFELIFCPNGSAVVKLTELSKGSSIVSRNGKYRVADGQIFMRIENEKEDPVRAVIRDSRLVLLPPDGEVLEEIFGAVTEDVPNQAPDPTTSTVTPASDAPVAPSRGRGSS